MGQLEPQPQGGALYRPDKGETGNPAGKPKGTIHLSTRIQNMLNDDEFTTQLVAKDGKKVAFKGNPAEAIIKTAILKAMSGDKSWADWLANNGYGIKQVHEFENNPIITILNKYGLKGDEDAGQTSEVED